MPIKVMGTKQYENGTYDMYDGTSSKNASKYLWEQITNHIARFFNKEIQDLIGNTDVQFIPYKEAINYSKKVIAIPTDVLAPAIISDSYKVSFNDTEVVLWHRLPKPQGEEWGCLPNSKTPLWYQKSSGTTIPAWNIYRVLFDLLTLKEETETSLRDSHGRFPATMSPRYSAGLLEVPIFNNAVALIVAAAMNLKRADKSYLDLKNCVRSPVVILSHDVDNLSGNDFWTQAIRVYRIFEPVRHGKIPQLKNINFIIKNFISPREYYFTDISRIMKIESHYNYLSSFYFLNGTGGRFGARAKPEHILEASRQIPDNWNIGIHYNYNHYSDAKCFESQVAELTKILGLRPLSGRAHYLRFDPEKSFDLLVRHNIICDESLGYSDVIGYRCGIAGPYNPYNNETESAYPLWEIPLTMMESALVQEYQIDYVNIFNKHLHHLSKVGGAISLLFHPGLLENPEFPETFHLYPKLLEAMKMMSIEGTSCAEFLNLRND